MSEDIEGSGRHVRHDILDAIPLRTVAMVFGVLLLQLGFVLSYVGAFHAPKPRHISLAVVAPPQLAPQVVNGFNAIPSGPLRARTVASATIARERVRQGSLSAAIILSPTTTADRLIVASGGGTSVVTSVEQVVSATEAQFKRTVLIEDVVPLQSGDGRGLTGFYLVTGWIVGGYLMAAILGVASGARPATPRRAAIRLISVVPYALLSGLGGALIVDQVLGALTGQFFALWLLGALLVFAAAAITMALQVLLGVIGIGAAVLLFVVLGNPSAGGAYQPALLPPFWRAMSSALPNGAGTDAVRRIVYFGGHGIGTHLVVITAYAAGGQLVTLAASAMRHRSESAVAGRRERA